MALLFLLGAQTIMAQDHVTNIRAKQEDKMVTVKYDLSTRSEVKLFISLDDGQHYTDTMKLTGNVNKIVPAGKNKIVRWQAFKDLGYGDYPEIRFKFVTQESAINQKQTYKPRNRRNTFATLNASYGSQGIPMLGLTVGQYGKYGWFVTLMTGLDFDYMGYLVVDHCNKEGYIDHVLPFYNPDSKTSAVSGMVGGIMQLGDMLYAKAGLGYGMRSVAWQLWNGDYVTNDGFSAHGVDVGAGLLLDMNRLVLTLDGVTTNFHVFEARLGLGFRFTK